MGKLTIIGNDKPVIGKQEMYSVSAISGWLNPLQPIKNPLQIPKAHWEVMVQTKTGWRKGGSDKEGQMVPYIFGQKSLLHKGIKIVVQQGNDKGELIVHPQRAKEPKITRVELLDANYKPIPKGKKLSYKDTIIARAYCVEMFGMNIAFTLWEDDAQGEGHNPTVNALNKINPVPVLSRVNEKGMAEAVFRLPFYTMAVLIANARTASGDKSEGPTHEYYVTADVVSKHIQKASPNINVVNPTYNPEPPRKREVPKKHTPSPGKPKTTPAPEKPKPKPDGNSAKFPVTTGGKKSDDPQGKILSAEFVDENGNRLHSSKVGTTVFMKITAKDMKNKKVKVKIWEKDNIRWTNDPIFEKDYELLYDKNFFWIVLTKKMFIEGNDGGSDSAKQDYFIEVIHNDTSVKSAVMPVSIDATPTEVPSGNSATMIKEPKQGKTPTSCICKEQYKDLVWGGKVSCEFRKKVVQIAKNLGLPQKDLEGANWLMTIIALESAYSFSPKIGTFGKDPDESKANKYIGLIQFGKGAASDIGTTRTHLMSLTAEQQLEFVEKHFKQKKFDNLLISRTALYLAVNYPNSTKHASNKNYVVYNSSNAAYDSNDLFKREKHEYKIKKDGTKEYPDDVVGSTYVWEMEEALEDVGNLGKSHKVKKFECGVNNATNEKINAKDIVTYHIYENGTIEKHIPKKIKEEYAKKYKYVYHDKEKNEHEICIVDWFTVDKRNNGKKISSIPKGYINTYSYPSGGNAKTAYEYSNGDICVSGTEYGYRKYSKGQGKVPLVRMKDSLNYKKNDIKILYSFQRSQRRYCNPDAYAGFIGALAKLGREDVLCTGMCFADATSYPSVTHPNGDCADTAYYSTQVLEQKKVNAFKAFHFEKIYRGKGGWYSNLKGTNYSPGHEDHLHSGEFNTNIIKIIEEK